jgi:hypothetical protein
LNLDEFAKLEKWRASRRPIATPVLANHTLTDPNKGSDLGVASSVFLAKFIKPFVIERL